MQGNKAMEGRLKETVVRSFYGQVKILIIAKTMIKLAQLLSKVVPEFVTVVYFCI